VLLRNDLGLQILSLYPVLRGTLLTSKRCWIPDFVAVHGTPGHFAYFERPWIADFVAAHGAPGHLAHFGTILDCRFCRCARDSGAFCLLRSDIGLQILSLRTRLRGIWFTSKRPWIADFVAVHGTPGHLA
jgi:hypothetical protein